ncbi:MAG: 3-(cis-5,6-dihydroxycyclohexa-1,3-dien-1-yl)propanoate dehydrogenase [Rugosibacter sp.]
MRLHQEVALVTGGGSGIGYAIVERFIAEGASVGVLIKEEKDALPLKQAFGEKVEVTLGDVRNFTDNQRAVAATVARFGKLDCFIGNAGIWDFMAGLETQDVDKLESSFHELFDVNVKGYVLGAKAVLPALRASKGCMIFTASTSSFFTGGGGPLYIATKHAVLGFIRALAWELAPEIRVNGVAPGGTLTRIFGTQPEADISQMISAITPLGFAAKPEDHSGIYAMLASRSDGKFITGTVILNDGGISIGKRASGIDM